MSADIGGTNYYQGTGVPITAPPYTIVCWAYPTTATTHTCVSLNQNGFSIYIRIGTGTSNKLLFTVADGTSTVSINPGSAPTNSWIHIGGRARDSSYHDGWLRGSLVATDSSTTINYGALAPTVTSLGSLWGTSQRYSGRIAEIAVYNQYLSDGEMVALSRGYAPLSIRPRRLAAYWPAVRPISGLRNYITGARLPAAASTVAGDHLPQLKFRRRTRNFAWISPAVEELSMTSAGVWNTTATGTHFQPEELSMTSAGVWDATATGTHVQVQAEELSMTSAGVWAASATGTRITIANAVPVYQFQAMLRIGSEQP